MGVGGFLKRLGFGPKAKPPPLAIGSQRGPAPEQVLNARPQPGFVPAQRVAPVPNGSRGPAHEYVSDWLSADEAKELITTDAQGRPNLRLAKREGDFHFTVGNTGRFISSRSRQLSQYGIWAFNVRGTNYRPGNGRTEEARPGSKLLLVREPANEFDPNAIAVHSGRGKILGYVNKANAARMAKLLDKGTKFETISLRGSAAGREPETVTALVCSAETLAWLQRRA